MNYAALNDGSGDDDDESEFGNGAKGFASDDEDELFDNVGVKEASMRQGTIDLDTSADMFDSLKEDTPVKKPAPAKRKLGAKPEVVKEPGKKRSKKAISDSDDSPVKVCLKKQEKCWCWSANYPLFLFSCTETGSKEEEEEVRCEQR